jgi:hypothetical protein
MLSSFDDLAELYANLIVFEVNISCSDYKPRRLFYNVLNRKLKSRIITLMQIPHDLNPLIALYQSGPN